MAVKGMKGDNEYDTLWTSLKDCSNAGCYSKRRLLLLLSFSQCNSSCYVDVAWVEEDN